MNLYIIRHNGLCLGGYSLVFADSPNEAKRLITVMLTKKFYSPHNGKSEFDITIQKVFLNVTNNKKEAYLICDGDY